MKLTQDQLADMCGVTKGAISQFEKGLTLPALGVLVCIAKRLQRSIDQLVGADTALPVRQRVLDGMSLDDRIAALPEALREFVLEALRRAEAVASQIPEEFIRPPTSENWQQFATYLESITLHEPKE